METRPAGLDWDACLGWLPKIPWDPKRNFNRFAYWDFATGGQTGGLFVHWVDLTVPGGPEPPHMANWLDCIRTRKQPHADVVSGNYPAMSCHMMNMAYREKSCINWRQEWDV